MMVGSSTLRGMADDRAVSTVSEKNKVNTKNSNPSPSSPLHPPLSSSFFLLQHTFDEPSGQLVLEGEGIEVDVAGDLDRGRDV